MSTTKKEAEHIGNTLKPCPFCGNKLTLNIRGKGDLAYNPSAKCKTDNCWGAKLPVVFLDRSEDVRGWNTRPARGFL